MSDVFVENNDLWSGVRVKVELKPGGMEVDTSVDGLNIEEYLVFDDEEVVVRHPFGRTIGKSDPYQLKVEYKFK